MQKHFCHPHHGSRQQPNEGRRKNASHFYGQEIRRSVLVAVAAAAVVVFVVVVDVVFTRKKVGAAKKLKYFE